ncbi:hypothetical protein CDAR_16891 [Caerostris darwini]|uniref:Uncharacterized protein n=1 Tax=Caerostris darwini TaxID=1538125 RepID=A0AAV4PPD5_9ARAC|nr:hypothetical protein CDAR_16891 [Caerostris darwini]
MIIAKERKRRKPGEPSPAVKWWRDAELLDDSTTSPRKVRSQRAAAVQPQESRPHDQPHLSGLQLQPLRPCHQHRHHRHES